MPFWSNRSKTRHRPSTDPGKNSRLGFSGPGYFWLGLDAIHDITTSSSCRLCIFMSSSSKWQYIEYFPFQILDESTNYRLQLTAKTASNGTIGDALGNQNNQAFSTYDDDNDQDAGHNCASALGAGWWYGSHTSNSPFSSYSCGQSNINSFSSSFFWSTWTILQTGSALKTSQVFMNCVWMISKNPRQTFNGR